MNKHRTPPKMYITRARGMAGVQSVPRVMRGTVVRPIMREVPLDERHLSGIDSQGMAHTLSGRLFAGAIGEDTTLTPGPPVATATDYMPVLTTIDDRTKVINDKIDAQNKNRKISLMIAGASALFAAVKLGIIAFPHIKSRVTGSSL